jgi:hypothetical protein
MRERFDALSGRIAEAYAATPPEEGLAEIDSLVAQERIAQERAGQDRER